MTVEEDNTLTIDLVAQTIVTNAALYTQQSMTTIVSGNRAPYPHTFT